MQLTHVPIVAGLKLFWDRVTFSRLTKIYFFFSVLHCIFQVVFQVQAFVANADAARFLTTLVQQGNASDPGFAVYNGDLRMCEQVPNRLDASNCALVWDGRTNAKSMSSMNNTNYVANVSTFSATPPAVSVVSTQLAVSNSSSSVASATTPSTPTLPSPSSPSSALPSVSTSSSSSSADLSFTTATTSSSPSASPSINTTSTIQSTITDIVTVTSTTTSANSATSTPKVNIQVPDDSDEEDGEESDSDSESGDGSDDSDSDGDDSDEEEENVEETNGEEVTSPQNGTVSQNATLARRDINFQSPKNLLTLNGTVKVNLGGLHGLQDVDLPRKCLYSLNWPIDNVENTKREDVAFIAFQFWLLGMSLVALLNESIPHIVASMLTHILATAWGGFQIYNTEEFHKKFTHLTTNGACGINLLPNYWKSRSDAEIPSLALNCFALLVSAILSWRLMKTFGWQTFKRVGASRTINRVYRLVLMFSISIQLSLFFVGASAGLWLDQVYNGNIGRLTVEPKVFKAVMITVIVLLVPWLTTGWVSVRKEYRVPMIGFLAVAVLVLVGWATMFIAATFRWTYATWLFFSLMTTTAVILTLLTLVLGVVCRINFDKGLTRYLNAHEELNGGGYEDEKVYDSEKIAFPSNDSPIPTFSVTFGSGQEVPPPSQMRFTPRSMGPRFSQTNSSNASNPFDTPSYSNTLRSGTVALSRHDSQSSHMSDSSTDSASSAQSAGSSASAGSSMGSSGGSRGRRWVIE